MGDAKHTETRDVPVAYLIKGADTSYLQWSPEVADCDRDLVTIVPLYAHSSERSALLKCEEALRDALLFIRNGVELGFIHIPKNDPASETLPKIVSALSLLDEARNGK